MTLAIAALALAVLKLASGQPSSTTPGATTSLVATTTELITEAEVAEGGAISAFVILVCWGACFCIPVGLQLLAWTRSSGRPAGFGDLDIERGSRPREDLFGRSITLKQLWKPKELCCNYEAKNRYLAEDGTLYIHEISDGLQRCCCAVNRELTFFAHAGPDKQAPTVMRMYKPFHLAGCCFCRPEMDIDLPNSQRLGHIDDPFKCCIMDQYVYDAYGNLRFEVTGSSCQAGTVCPRCADVYFDVLDESGCQVGQITKPRENFGERWTGTNRFTVDFPRQCSMKDKSLLVASSMLLDIQYFENNGR